MARQRGFEKTVSIIIAIVLRSVFSNLRYVPKRGVVVEVNNSKMLVFPQKGAIHRELFVQKKREIRCTDHLLKGDLLKEGDVVLDIGANIGYYVLIESQLVGANGKIYAIEPIKENIEVLKKNVQLNGLENVCIFQRAFGEQNMKSKIYVSNFSNLSSMIEQYAGGEIVNVQDVTLTTVDTFLETMASPSFIRMDVEGYEYEIFAGMTQTLQRNLRILVELHSPFLGEKKLDELFQILRRNKFSVRFAVFEGKINENKIINTLERKGGVDLPTFSVSNISLQDLRNLIAEYPALSPNVLFEKQN